MRTWSNSRSKSSKNSDSKLMLSKKKTPTIKLKSLPMVANLPQVTTSSRMTNNSLMDNNNNTHILASKLTLQVILATQVGNKSAILMSVSSKQSTSTKKSTICMSVRAWSQELTCTDVQKLWAAGPRKMVSLQTS